MTPHKSSCKTLYTLPFLPCKLKELESVFCEQIKSNEQTTIATINLYILRLAFQDKDYLKSLKSFSFCTADGWPILALLKRQGHIFPERVTGSDTTEHIWEWAIRHDWKIGVLGGADTTKQHLSTLLKHTYAMSPPHWTPHYPANEPLEDKAICKEINSHAIDILLVALGCPKQEKWISQNKQHLNAKILIGVGASLKFLAKEVDRAPIFFKKNNLEFLYRFFKEPKYLGKRYFLDFLFYLKLRANRALTP